jgi:hypothetical protein
MSNYSKWDAIGEDDDDPPEQPVTVDDPLSARRNAEAAKAAGAKPSPLEDLFTLGTSSSAADVMQKMRRLPPDAKRRFLEGIQSGAGRDLLEKALPGGSAAMAAALSGSAAPASAPRATPPSAAPAPAAERDDPRALVGQRVVLSDLQARPELNGRQGTVVQYVAAKGRCAVRLDGAAEADAPLALKPACLRRA